MALIFILCVPNMRQVQEYYNTGLHVEKEVLSQIVNKIT